MRLGIIADIHANLHALAVVLHALDADGAELIVCAGDLVCYGAHPNETLDRLRERGIPTVVGNYDDAVAWNRPRASRTPSSPATEPLKQAALAWTQAQIAARGRAYLRGLPWTLGYRIDGLRLAVVHAGLDYLDEWITPAQPDALAQLVATIRADVIVLGHTHQAFVQHIKDATVINPGAVGRALDGDPRAAYAVLDTTSRAVDLRRVAYDVEAAAHAIVRSGMPAEIGVLLRHGARWLEEVMPV
jgi:putative phosphoesterase